MRRESEKIYIVQGHQQEGTDLMLIRTMVMMITVRMMAMTMVMAMMALVITMTIYVYSAYDIYIYH